MLRYCDLQLYIKEDSVWDIESRSAEEGQMWGNIKDAELEHILNSIRDHVRVHDALRHRLVVD